MTSTATIERFVTSEDGTRIGYLRQGRGPGIVLVQGAMADAHAYSRLAADLAPSFSVYSADRRGRGLSPKPYQASHDIARDIEDIDAILAETGANYVFGLSSDAVITLEAARTLDRVEKAAVYEPRSIPTASHMERSAGSTTTSNKALLTPPSSTPSSLLAPHPPASAPYPGRWPSWLPGQSSPSMPAYRNHMRHSASSCPASATTSTSYPAETERSTATPRSTSRCCCSAEQRVRPSCAPASAPSRTSCPRPNTSNSRASATAAHGTPAAGASQTSSQTH